MISAGLAVALGLGVLVLTLMWPAAIIAAAVGGLAPYIFLRRKRSRRFYQFEEQLPDAIDMLGRAIRAGHPLSSGLKMVADEAKEPVAGEFRRTHEEHRFGLAFEDAMLAMADRVGIVDVRILVTAILIQREVGGNLAEVLDNLASVIRARFTIRRQLRVYTAQGRFSGYVLARAADRGRHRDLFAQPVIHEAPVHGSDGQADDAHRGDLPDHRLPLDPQDRRYRDLRRACY